MAFEQLQALGMGIIGFALIVGTGTIVLTNFGGAVANCESNYSSHVDGATNGNDTVWNSTTENCQFLDNGATQNGSGYTTETSGYEITVFMNTQLGTTGLAGWTPAIIAITVGMLFLGYFMFKKGGKY